MKETLSDWWAETSKDMRKLPEYKRWARRMTIRLWFWDKIEKHIIHIFRRKK